LWLTQPIYAISGYAERNLHDLGLRVPENVFVFAALYASRTCHELLERGIQCLKFEVESFKASEGRENDGGKDSHPSDTK
jgi:hypothetical protein